jgi:protein SCO1/2
MTSRRLLLALAAASALALCGCERSAPAHHFNAVDLTGAEYARQFDLPDFDGRPRTLADFKGKVTAVFFGYTQCPDACPTTMAELAGIEKSLGPDAARMQVVFITVDPSRDTAALLKGYVTNFRPDFLALRGDDAQTRAVAKEFKVFYEKVPGRTDGTYTIDHTAGTYLFDTQGRIRLFASQSLDPSLLALDVRALLAEKS